MSAGVIFAISSFGAPCAAACSSALVSRNAMKSAARTPPSSVRARSTSPFALRRFFFTSREATSATSATGLKVAAFYTRAWQARRRFALDGGPAMTTNLVNRARIARRVASPTRKREPRQARKGATVARKGVAGPFPFVVLSFYRLASVGGFVCRAGPEACDGCDRTVGGVSECAGKAHCAQSRRFRGSCRSNAAPRICPRFAR